MENKHYPTYLQSIGLIFIYFLYIVLGVVVLFFFSQEKNNMALFLISSLALVATIFTALKIRGNYQFALNKFNPAIVVIAAIVSLSFHLAVAPITDLFPISENLKSMFGDVYQYPILLFVFIVICAPIFEELFFRGIMLEGLLKNYNAIRAIVFTAFLFALIHGNLVQGFGAFFLGLLSGWVYLKTKSIIPCIVIHFVNNLTAFVSMFFTKKEDLFKSTQEQIGNPVYYWLLVLSGLIVTCVGVWLLQKRYLGNAIVVQDENLKFLQ